MAEMKNGIKACVFDFDGTLVDTMQGFADLAGELLQKFYGIDFQEGRRRYLETSGIPFFQQLEIIRPGGEHNRSCAEEFERRKLDGFFSAKPAAETVRAIEALRASGRKVIVSSNNFQSNIEAFMERHEVPVDVALGFDESRGLEKGRPHFEYVRALYGLESKDMLFCGDSLKDAERALACGVRFVGIEGTFSREQFIEAFPQVDTVSNLGELVRLITADA